MVLEATAAREGLHATASRVVVWGEPDAHFRCEFDAALRLGVAWHAASKADATTVDILTAGVAALPKVSASEVDWLTVPPGWVTGRERTELILSARVAEPLRNDWALSWSARVGPAVCGETMIVTPEGPVCVTPPGPEGWPVRRAKLGGQNYDRPDLLIRSDTA
jgi:hypothetical protein